MSLIVLGLILATVTLSACAQLALKLGVGTQSFEVAMRGGVFDVLIATVTNIYICVGLTIYLLSVAMWLWILTKVDLSVAYPFVGVSFLVTMAFGIWLLDEDVTTGRVVGTVLIVVGCTLVGRSA